MALNFKDAETDRLAREIAALTGESLTEAVRRSLAERLERERQKAGEPSDLAGRLMEIGSACASLPDIDTRSADEILGYNEYGHFD